MMANTNYPTTESPRNNPPRNNNTKNILIGVLAAGLLGTWGYFLYDKNQSDEKIQVTQTQANMSMSSRDSVQLLYNDALTRLDSLTGNNNNLQGQLGERQSDIRKLKNEINSILRKRNATQAELSRAKSLISTLNGKIANLEQEVARLTGENQQLASNNTQLTSEKQVLETNLQTTTAEKDELASTVDVASTFSASNIQIKPVNEKKNGKEKETTTAKRVDKLVVSFDVENRVARTGPADLYVVVTGPNGQVVSDPSMGSGTLTTRTDGDRQFTYKSTLNYEQGTRKSVQIPLRQNDFQTGNYKIEIYQNGFKIAEGVRSLKKGGLFG
jgi:predicted  nucleic acid-binding Zn-ribbon protein